MCGICGKFSLNSTVERDALLSMRDIMYHRGPDDSGIYINNNIGLGHRRLSILDLSVSGRQPMANEDETIWVVFNGEIYNYIELRSALEKRGHVFKSKTDTEIILHAYEEHGLDSIAMLEGMFAFGLWDETKERLILARDRLGIKPLYFYRNGSDLIFASEIKAILLDKSVNATVDLQSLSNFLTLHYVPAPRTMFKGIEKLPPGHFMVINQKDIYSRPYWDLVKETDHVEGDERDLIEELSYLLRASVKKRLQSDVPVGTLLSGGLDSTSILGLMTDIADHPVKSFTVGFSEDGNDNISEFKFARIASNHFASTHYETVVDSKRFLDFLPRAIWFQDEPIGEPASIPLYYICEMAKNEGITVLLTGEGADELFAGYNRHWGEILSTNYRKVPNFIREGLIKPFLNYLPNSHLLSKAHRSMTLRDFKSRFLSWHTVFTDDLKNDLLLLTGGGASDTFSDVFEKYNAKLHGLSDLDKLLYLDAHVWLPDDLLMKKDKMGMAASIEARVPFLDHRLVEFAFNLPSKYKVNRFRTKYLLKKSMNGLLPEEIIKRKKKGFPTPISGWLKNELNDLTYDTLCSEGSLSHGFFDGKTINRLVDEHTKGLVDHSRLLFPLINFEIWYDLFIDGDSTHGN